MYIVCQIGAREHYAIPLALNREGRLETLLTDFWVLPGSVFSRLPGGRRLRERFHADLSGAQIVAPNLQMLAFELSRRLLRQGGWPVIRKRNRLFQAAALRALADCDLPPGSCLFSYSYAARDLFRYARERGWKTVLGQIDPGPAEERIVAAERERYRHLASSWAPAPSAYWDNWREEIVLADRVIVNSHWSRDCLLKEGIPEEKLELVPLVYESVPRDHASTIRTGSVREDRDATFRVLFLGQINLRKGAGRLLDAMRLLKDESITLTLAGPSEIPESAWADLPNVRRVGPVPRSEVGRYYGEADLFILPTLSDGYALTQLEALAHGLPVMASKHCGEAVKDGVNGVILEDLEPETIATALRRARTTDFPEVSPPSFGPADLAAVLG